MQGEYLQVTPGLYALPFLTSTGQLLLMLLSWNYTQLKPCPAPKAQGWQLGAGVQEMGLVWSPRFPPVSCHFPRSAWLWEAGGPSSSAGCTWATTPPPQPQSLAFVKSVGFTNRSWAVAQPACEHFTSYCTNLSSKQSAVEKNDKSNCQ